MLARQRQAMILDRVREAGAVRVADLVRELGVSDMTVRRDLEILDERGLLEKVHGGATLDRRASPCSSPGSPPSPRSSRTRSTRSPTRPRPSSSRAWRSASPPGTTTYALAQRLADIPGLTVVTNSIRVADVLHQVGRRDQTIILTGGVRTPSEALVGPFAVAALRTVHMDLVFVGVHGMDPQFGFTCPNLLEAETDRALIEAGRRLVVVADHTKWGVIGISSIARLDQADVLITDAGIDADARGRSCGRGPRSSSSSTRSAAVGAAPGSTVPSDPASGPTGVLPARGSATTRTAATTRSTDEWVLVSAGRTQRPWLGAEEPRGRPRPSRPTTPAATCARATRGPTALGTRPTTTTFVFDNDFAALRPDTSEAPFERRPAPRRGRARVVPRPLLLAAPRPDPRRGCRPTAIRQVVDVWADQTAELGADYRWVQVFENRGAAMGASNPHPHGQVWAGTALPARGEPRGRAPAAHLGRDRAAAAARLRRPGDRAARGSSSRTTSGWSSCPFWAAWPFETLRDPASGRRRGCPISTTPRATAWPPPCVELLGRYDGLFGRPFPYSMGWHQAPFGDADDIDALAGPRPLLPAAAARERPQVHGRLRAARRDPARPDRRGRRRAAAGGRPAAAVS